MRIEYTDGSIWLCGKNSAYNGRESALLCAFSSYVAIFPEPIVYYDFTKAADGSAFWGNPLYHGVGVNRILQYRHEVTTYPALVCRRKFTRYGQKIVIDAPVVQNAYALLGLKGALRVDGFTVLQGSDLWLATYNVKKEHPHIHYIPSQSGVEQQASDSAIQLTDFKNSLKSEQVSNDTLRLGLEATESTPVGSVMTNFLLKRLEWNGTDWEWDVGRYTGYLLYGSAANRLAAWERTQEDFYRFTYTFV